jgi:hypothetical protein
MIAGLPIDYAHARASARLARRPGERVWPQIRSARTVAALLEAMRASPAAAAVSGIDARAGPDDIERALRQQLRLGVAELARWAPQEWRAAVLWTRHLVDLPALAQLLATEPPAKWMATDPALAGFASAALPERRAMLLESELAPIVRALDGVLPGAPPTATHAALAAWRAQWRKRFPPCAAEDQLQIDALERDVVRHQDRFAAMPADQTADARAALATRALRYMRRNPARPVALFAYLFVIALDLERLRGEFALRSLFARDRP